MTKLSPAIVAIVALVVLELAAIVAGVNGKMFASVVALISGLGGYSIRNIMGGRNG